MIVTVNTIFTYTHYCNFPIKQYVYIKHFKSLLTSMPCIPIAQLNPNLDSDCTPTTPVSAPTITCCMTMSRGLKDSPLENGIFLTDLIELQDTDNRNIALQRLAARLDKKFAKEFHVVKKREEEELKQRLLRERKEKEGKEKKRNEEERIKQEERIKKEQKIKQEKEKKKSKEKAKTLSVKEPNEIHSDHPSPSWQLPAHGVAGCGDYPHPPTITALPKTNSENQQDSSTDMYLSIQTLQNEMNLIGHALVQNNAALKTKIQVIDSILEELQQDVKTIVKSVGW